MNFTREPIIETIISPKEGYKLLVRNSKGVGQGEYTVDAVEVVSFGRAFFLRCLEGPRCFVLPVTDYEVIEMRETRVVLKNAPMERTIKIGGGREASPRAPREEASQEVDTAAPTSASPVSEERTDKRRDRRRHRRRRMEERQRAPESQPLGEGEAQTSAPPVLTRVFPPPTTLISETLSRYKSKETSPTPPSPAEEGKEVSKRPPSEGSDGEGDGESMHRFSFSTESVSFYAPDRDLY